MDPVVAAVQQRYLTIIPATLGLPTCVADHGAVVVTYDGNEFILAAHEGDPEYLQVLTAVQVPPGVALLTLLRVTAAVCRDKKLVKAFPVLDDDDDGDHDGPGAGRVVLAVEVLVAGPDQLPDPQQVTSHLPRLLSALSCAGATLLETLELEASLHPGAPQGFGH